MQANAKLRFLRMSPKKVRLVADVIRGMKVEEAIIQLGFLNKAATRPLLKLLQSGIANAENNFDLQKDNLYIKEITVDQAGMLKRWMPRAHGRATPLRKKLSHIFILLDEIKPSKQKAKKKKSAKEKTVKVSSPEKIKESLKPEKLPLKKKEKLKDSEQEQEKDGDIQDVRMEGKHRHQQHQDKRSMKKSGGFIKKMFNRKAG